jgi:hypothetical protein
MLCWDEDDRWFWYVLRGWFSGIVGRVQPVLSEVCCGYKMEMEEVGGTFSTFEKYEK